MVAENRQFCRSLREVLQDPLDLRDEAHVEHAIGLVEDEVLDRASSRLPLEMWSIRRPGHATSTSRPRLNAASWIMIGIPPNAVQTLQVGLARVGAQVLGDLHAEFPRRHEDDGPQAGFAARGDGSASAGRTQRSCHCRSRRARSGSCQRGRSGSPGSGCRSGSRSQPHGYPRGSASGRPSSEKDKVVSHRV